ncbi:UNVERIFIED_CONTAM: DNA recombination protein RmuC, partial [Microbacterium sp. SLM126]
MLAHDGTGELRLLMPALRTLAAGGRRIGLVNPPYLPNAASLAAARLPARQVYWVRPTPAATLASQRTDKLWAAEQMLRSQAFGAVLVWLGRARSVALRRLQVLAQGVGDLKRVLTNVKTRGTWGEVQLAMLLEQILTPDQYSKNVETVQSSGARVEFAIRLPGREIGGSPVWLPFDAKFPKDQYERLVDAQERGDVDGVQLASRELEVAVRREAQTIAEKYLAPPATTDFAILFLPTEGLYAEVLRRPGLTDLLQRDFRVTVAGPTTLTALLNSLQMGFRTLALEKRSSEVWEVLGAVKTEFGKFGEVLAKTRDTLVRAARNIEQA